MENRGFQRLISESANQRNHAFNHINHSGYTIHLYYGFNLGKEKKFSSHCTIRRLTGYRYLKRESFWLRRVPFSLLFHITLVDIIRLELFIKTLNQMSNTIKEPKDLIMRQAILFIAIILFIVLVMVG